MTALNELVDLLESSAIIVTGLTMLVTGIVCGAYAESRRIWPFVVLAVSGMVVLASGVGMRP